MQKNSMACPAIPTCGLAISESERVLPEIIDEIEAALRELGLVVGTGPAAAQSLLRPARELL